MEEHTDFHFTIHQIPEGEALTFAEMEERLLKEPEVNYLLAPHCAYIVVSGIGVEFGCITR